MSVVLQAASFPTEEAARRAEAELLRLHAAYVAFEEADPDPWSMARVPPPLVAFGEAHGVAWPLREDARFLLRGPFAETAEVLRVDRLVFFWGEGFELGGKTLRTVLEKLGATVTTDRCALTVRVDDADAHAAELASFLDDEDFEGQFRLDEEDELALHRVALVDASGRRVLVFDDSGVEDWAFVAILPQLDGEDPELAG